MQVLDLHLLHWQAVSSPPNHQGSLCLGLSGPKLNHKREGYEDLTVEGRDKTMEAI